MCRLFNLCCPRCCRPCCCCCSDDDRHFGQHKSPQPKVNPIHEMTDVISGTGVYPGSKIFITLPNGYTITTHVQMGNGWYINSPVILLRGQVLTVSQLKLGEQIVSDPIKVIVLPQANEQTMQPIVFEPVRTNAKRIDGMGIPDALVQARFPCGNIFGGWVDNESKWHVLVMDELPAGSIVKVTQYEIFKGKAESEPVFVTVAK